MKRFTFISLLIICFVTTQALADDLFDEIKELAEDEAEEALTPMVEMFGTGVTGGLYHTAKTHGVLGFDIGFRTMMVLISDQEGVLDSADVALFPMPVVQASVGLPMDIEIMARGFTVPWQGETISLFGAGVKKNFQPLIPVPAFPNLSAMITYHKFNGGDIVKSSHFSFSVMASKKFVIIEPYIGFGIDKHSMDIEYDHEYEDELTGLSTIVPVELNIKETTSRFTLGLNLTPFPFVKIFADYNTGTFSEVTAGLAVSLR